MTAINVSGDTDNADILLLCDNGSYIICDVENEDGYCVIYMNESVDGDFENGLTIFLDESGMPVMASSHKGHFVFKDVTDENFDFAFINNKDEVSYYNDININRSTLPTRNYFDPWIQSIKSPTGGVWDEHAKKAIVPFLLKIVSFIISASDAVWGTGQLSLLYTFASEADKSSNNAIEWLDGLALVEFGKYDFMKLFKDGELVFSPNKFLFSYLSYLLNEYADQELNNLSQYEELVGPYFNSEEWQIKLYPNSLEFGPDAERFFVDVIVDSRVAWDIDDSKIDHNWCEVQKLDVQVVVYVKANESEYDRTCELIIYPKYSKEISPVTLEIKQSGIIFNLYPDTLTFTQAGGTKGFTIISNENIRSWSVSSYPSWCKIEKGGDNSYWVVVEKNEKEDKDDIITVTGITKGGMPINRTLIVEQKYQLCPDNKHPHMIDLGLPSGTKWACCNIGATKPKEKGNLFAWGETDPKESFGWKSYLFWSDINNDGFLQDGELKSLGDDIGGTDYDAAKVNWGNSWRMPTDAEYNELITNTGTTIYSSEIDGRYIIGKNGNKIIMPCNSEQYEYWTSVMAKPDYYYPFIGEKNAKSFRITYDWVLVGLKPRCDGLYIRAVSK